MCGFINFLETALKEEDFNNLIRQVDVGRMERSKDVFAARPTRTTTKNGNKVIKFEVKSDPSVTNLVHKGFVVASGNDVRRMFCTCPDFFNRVYDDLTKKGLSTIDELPNKYKLVLRKWSRTDKPPVNKDFDDVYMCKHVAAILQKYV